jgi:hypothetical protein
MTRRKQIDMGTKKELDICTAPADTLYMDTMKTSNKEPAMKRPAKSPAVRVSICLYGTSRVGFYCLADTTDGRRFGKMPEQGGHFIESASVAIWTIARAIVDAGVSFNAETAIHMDRADGSPVVAFATLGSIPSFGSLKFGQGGGVVISAEAIVAAAERA